ncbi:hypothetical protein BDP27DRAFT_1319081 [Rhodocollybia butyracea]|uniref:Uncharacterized protein n=1 Tax=Rhodocollybia butyracea TaxID=206335 RepID=A0A9P5Q0F7_9AGAR|nr:hypothetical protein BDP27DRAFT_1319081 [Rhodocollybia butyracea]
MATSSCLRFLYLDIILLLVLEVLITLDILVTIFVAAGTVDTLTGMVLRAGHIMVDMVLTTIGATTTSRALVIAANAHHAIV